MTNKLNLSNEELLDLLISTIEIDYEGTKRWHNESGALHRRFGPAVEYTDGYVEYWVNGKMHREDGPAVEWVNFRSYYINGKQVKPF